MTHNWGRSIFSPRAAARRILVSRSLSAAVIVLAPVAMARAGQFLPSIPKGNIALTLQPVATGLAAPDYGFSPPGDTGRLFVLEQSGLIRVIQNGTLLPTPALDITARTQPPLVAS